MDSSLQANDSKRFDSYGDSNLIPLDQIMTLTQLEKILDVCDSTLTRQK